MGQMGQQIWMGYMGHGSQNMIHCHCRSNYRATSNNMKLAHWPNRLSVTFGTARIGPWAGQRPVYQ